MKVVHPLKPVYNSESKVLILGSFPSIKSRENNFYYGNPKNRFWSTLEKVFNPKTGKPYSVTTDVAKELANAMKMPIEDLIYKLDETQEIEVNSNESNLNNDTPILNDRTHTVRVPIYRYHSCRFTS